jgi:hypothetical protein
MALGSFSPRALQAVGGAVTAPANDATGQRGIARLLEMKKGHPNGAAFCRRREKFSRPFRISP